MADKLHPVILCGGSGTRLWPLSREFYPKQMLRLTEENSMLQATIHRKAGIETLGHTLLISNQAQRFLVAEQAREAGDQDAVIMLEPEARNTAPAVTLAAQYVLEHENDGLLLVMPADHVIQDVEAFQQAVLAGISHAEAGALVTFGIVPHHPETGYGYIRKGTAKQAELGFLINAFVEKPDRQRAQQFVDSGDYFWNSGMFLFKASTWMQAIEALAPDMAQAVSVAYQNGEQDIDFFRADAQAFGRSPSDSIDYAVMEHLTEGHAGGLPEGVVIPLDAGWSDVGSWQSLWEVGEKDEQGNLLQGDVYLESSKDSIVVSGQRMVAGIGLDNMIVVETPDAILVADKSASQEVKKIVARLKQEGRDEVREHRCVHRPWGSYEGIDRGERFQVKRIIVKPNARLSLQMHHHRAEHWIVVRGTARVTRGDDMFLLGENESTFIPLGVRHRLENPGTIPLEIIEVQSGSYLGEDDIVRFDDVYGREDAADSQ